MKGINIKRGAKFNVFLKCLRCGTFVTSPSKPAFKNHLDNCRHNKLIKLPGANENVANDTEGDFFDDQMEKVEFPQLCLVLPRCKVKQRQIKLRRSQRNTHMDASKKIAALSKLENSTNLNVNGGESEREDNINSVKIAKTLKTKFNCDTCGAWYKTQARLERHKQRIHTNKSGHIFTCPICNRMMKKRGGVAGFHAHLNQHEHAEALEQKFNLWKKWAKKPNKSYYATTFSCKYCFMPCSNHRNFLSHMAINHSDKGENCIFKCPYNCSAQLDSIKNLIAHFKSAHPEEYFALGDIITADGRRKERCKKCDKFFDSRYLPSHMETHLRKEGSLKKQDSYACPYPNCGTICKSGRLLKCHFILHLEKNPYVCNFPGCKTKTDASYHLKKHIKLKHLKVPQNCSKCGVTYLRREIFKNHKCEDNINKVKCGGYKLIEISGFWRLTPAERKIENEIVNSTIDPGFVSTHTLDKDDPNDKVNEYIESLKRIDINPIIRSDPVFIQACKDNPGFGELIFGPQFSERFHSFQKKLGKVYKCPKCPTVFAGRLGFKNHKTKCRGRDDLGESSELIRVDVDTVKMLPVGEKSLQIGCPACGKPFESEDLLEKHLKKDHRSSHLLKCDEPDCGRYFPSSSLKEQHFERVHVTRPYQCDKCKLGFVRETSLEKHLEEHRFDPNLGANKIPACKVCGKVLSSLRNRRQHMQHLHGISSPHIRRQRQLKPKKKTIQTKKIIKKRKTVKKTAKTPELTAFELAEYPLNKEKLVLSVKIEPDLIIESDLIKTEIQDFPSYGQIETNETN